MRKSRLTLGIAVLIFPTTLLADSDLRLSASTAINFKTGEYVPKSDPDTGFKFTNTTLDLALILSTSRFFVALNYDSVLKEDYTVINKGTIEVEITRRDEGLTIGYDVYRGLNVLLGYKIGETEQQTVRTNGMTAKSGSYFDKGPFVGLSYGYNLGAVGTLSASVAYANLKGEISVLNQLTQVSQSTGGTTSGLSYGIKWSKDVRDGTTLSIGYKQNKYRFVDKDISLSGGSPSDLTQDFGILYVQATNYFN